MQDTGSSNPVVVTRIWNPNKSRAQHHLSLKLGSKLKYLKIPKENLAIKDLSCLLFDYEPRVHERQQVKDQRKVLNVLDQLLSFILSR